VVEQGRRRRRHVAHVGRAHADGEVHVIDQRADVGEQLAQAVERQPGLLPAVGREPDAEHHARDRRPDLRGDPRHDGDPPGGILGSSAAVGPRRQELGQQVPVRGVQLDDLETGLGGM
jgi:hypothetical protein